VPALRVRGWVNADSRAAAVPFPHCEFTTTVPGVVDGGVVDTVACSTVAGVVPGLVVAVLAAEGAVEVGGACGACVKAGYEAAVVLVVEVSGVNTLPKTWALSLLEPLSSLTPWPMAKPPAKSAMATDPAAIAEGTFMSSPFGRKASMAPLGAFVTRSGGKGQTVPLRVGRHSERTTIQMGENGLQ
jgi:hypothetical protein